MGRTSYKVKINPELLIWARKTSGYTIEEIAQRLKKDAVLFSRWESGEEQPTYHQLEQLANYYKRPLAAFFLPAPPPQPAYPPSFRSLFANENEEFDHETIFRVRRSRWIQGKVKEIAAMLGETSRYKDIRININNASEDEADRIRKITGIDIKDQMKWRNEYTALNSWKRAIESIGILVLQLSFPVSDGRGFSLYDSEFPVIVINSKDSPNGRIFSLFHELAHILLHKSFVFKTDRIEELDYLPQPIKEQEIFCNHFSGAFLVPRLSLIRNEIVQSGETITDEDIKELAKTFSVSRYVILRRLLTCNKISRDFYREKVEEFSRYKKEKNSGDGFARFTDKRINENGLLYSSLVIEAFNRNKISLGDVSDCLNIKLKHFDEYQDKLIKKMV